MKVRWRQHEIVLGTILVVLALAGFGWQIYRLTPEEIKTMYEARFIAHHAPFNLFRNVLLPQFMLYLTPFACFLWLNKVVIPYLLNTKEKLSVKTVVKKTLWGLFNLPLLTGLLGLGIAKAEYFRSEFLFNYPGFTFFPKPGVSTNVQLNVPNSFWIAESTMLLYIAYAVIREGLIYFFEHYRGRKEYRVSIVNQVTSVIVIYLSVIAVPTAFESPGAPGFIAFISLVLPVSLVVLGNMYWLFPWAEKRRFFSLPVIGRLLLFTFASTFLFGIARPLSLLFLPSFLLCWLIQLLVITPISWLLYQQRKDKILQLRGVEKALVKSTASLQLLRAQINPHFLFNVLNSLYGTALQENAGRTAEGIQKLGDMMRFMLHDNNLDQIEMTCETAYLENYIALQQLRTQNSPDITIVSNISTQHCNQVVAPMLFIPFVENAFKHGISLREKSWINIRLYCTEREIHFEVRNSVHPFQPTEPENEKSGIGLNNVLERLKLLYPDRHTISTKGDGQEFFVQLVIRP